MWKIADESDSPALVAVPRRIAHWLDAAGFRSSLRADALRPEPVVPSAVVVLAGQMPTPPCACIHENVWFFVSVPDRGEW